MIFRIKKFFSFLVVAALLTTEVALACSVVWCGGYSDNWVNSSNWHAGIVPTMGDTAVFFGNPLLLNHSTVVNKDVLKFDSIYTDSTLKLPLSEVNKPY